MSLRGTGRRVKEAVAERTLLFVFDRRPEPCRSGRQPGRKGDVTTCGGRRPSDADSAQKPHV